MGRVMLLSLLLAADGLPNVILEGTLAAQRAQRSARLALPQEACGRGVASFLHPICFSPGHGTPPSFAPSLPLSFSPP